MRSLVLVANQSRKRIAKFKIKTWPSQNNLTISATLFFFQLLQWYKLLLAIALPWENNAAIQSCRSLHFCYHHIIYILLKFLCIRVCTYVREGKKVCICVVKKSYSNSWLNEDNYEIQIRILCSLLNRSINIIDCYYK